MSNTIIQFKRGATFSMLLTYLKDGIITPLDGVVVTSQLRDANNQKIADLTYTQLETVGQYQLTCSDTSSWPLATVYGDVKYVTGSETAFDPGFSLQVIAPITQ